MLGQFSSLQTNPQVLQALANFFGAMAQNKLKVIKPKAMLFDMISTVAKASFIDNVLLPYIKTNAKTYFEENWSSEAVKMDITNLQSMAKLEPNAPQIPTDAAQAVLIEAAVAFVAYCVDKGKTSDAITLLRFHMWFDGFKRGRIETPVYSDVASKLRKWRHGDKVRLFVVSNGWSEATKRFLMRTNHGDLNALIEDHFDTELGELTEPATFQKALDVIKEPPESVLFLTKSASEARAALNAGLSAILVMTHRRNIEKLDEDGKKIPRVRSFNDIEFN